MAADEVFSLLRHEADLRARRWRWLPPWRDALLVALAIWAAALSGFLLADHAADTPPPSAPATFQLTDPFSQQPVTCRLEPGSAPARYECKESP